MSTSEPLPGLSSRAGTTTGFWRNVPPPMFILQPLLSRIVARVAARCPEVFTRLGEHSRKRFLIDPVDLPFMLLLLPDAGRPEMRAVRRGQSVARDVQVSAPFLSLLSMIDGRSDGDALFFNRDLQIEGDTEAIVALRNALDDMDNTLVDEVAASFGPLARPVRAVADFLQRKQEQARP